MKEIKFNNRPNNSYEVDGKTVWESRSIAVTGVIIAKLNSEYFVLINKRGVGAADYVGKYNVCSGYLDWDETTEDAFRREVYEETGIDIINIKVNNNILFDYTERPIFTSSSPTNNRQNVTFTYGIIFETHIFPKTTTIYSEPDEVSEIKWINIKDVNNYSFAFNHDKKIISFFNSFSNNL